MGRLRPSISCHERALLFVSPADRTADLFNIAQAYRELGDARAAERYAREAVARRAMEKSDPAITAMVWADLATIE